MIMMDPDHHEGENQSLWKIIHMSRGSGADSSNADVLKFQLILTFWGDEIFISEIDKTRTANNVSKRRRKLFTNLKGSNVLKKFQILVLKIVSYFRGGANFV